MKKETMKAKIARLESEKKIDLVLIQTLNQEILTIQKKADQYFENSGYKNQLEQQLDFQTSKAKVYEKEVQLEENRNARLKKQLEELSSENKRLKAELRQVKTQVPKRAHNERNAGRKRKITEKQIAEIQMFRAQGMTLKAIQKEIGLSYGIVQKYCKAIKN